MADYTFPVIRTQHPKPKPPQDKLGFANYFTDHMFEMRYDEGQGWHDGKVIPYGPISLAVSYTHRQPAWTRPS